MKQQFILLAVLAFSVPQMRAIETDQCAELAEQLRDKQEKVSLLEARARNEDRHNDDVARAFVPTMGASALSGVCFAVYKALESHLRHNDCIKGVGAYLGVVGYLGFGAVSLLQTPTLISNTFDSERPGVERFGSLCAALVGIAPAAVAAYLVASGAVGACSVASHISAA